MRLRGARTLTVSTGDATNKARKLGGPLRMVGWSFNGGGAGNSQTVDQSAAAPGAGANIAILSLNNGVYQVEWTFELSGTPGAGDVDNVIVQIGVNQVATSVNPGAVGNYGQEEIQVAVTNGPLVLAFKALGAATAGTTYKIEANVISQTPAQGTIFDSGQPLHFLSMPAAGTDREWLGLPGIAIDTELAVQTTLGSLSGVIWYHLQSDIDAANQPDHYGG